MPKRDTAQFHHPIDHAAATLAAKAVPQVFGRGDDQAGGVVFMKRAFAREVFAHLAQLDPGSFDQTLYADLVF